MNHHLSLARIGVRLLLAVLLLASPVALSTAQAGLLKPGEESKPAADKKPIRVTLTDGPEGRATDTFAPDTAKIYLLWKGDAFKIGDKLRSVWIAEDVGEAAPKNTKIDEATLTLEGAQAHGNMTLSKPTKDFPAGSYRVELYLNDDIVETVKFTIGAPK